MLGWTTQKVARVKRGCRLVDMRGLRVVNGLSREEDSKDDLGLAKQHLLKRMMNEALTNKEARALVRSICVCGGWDGFGTEKSLLSWESIWEFQAFP